MKELKGYGRVALQPGESKSATSHLPLNQLAFYDAHLDGEFELCGAAKMSVTERVFVTPVTIG